ncbi:pentatricopeptide repeat-containing protein At5g56310-like [Phoenix dactylifera]|uniref:Pentatricopeptide repeat-containing protein At5g56310-like n=1 Tax=Phoenix dactylifera TaxID=42345 RepID=A0A8B9AGT2_PHODC|nr:pentatricopeptide repeat-containing protein At5g56310-like [Phoenix dactylifera]
MSAGGDIHHQNAAISATLLSLSDAITCMPRLKRIHARLIRHLHHLPTATTHLILAKLLLFAAISPSGNLRYASLLFSNHLRHLTAGAFFYNTLIRGYANSRSPSLSLSLFISMRRLSVPPDPFSFTFLLKGRARCRSSSSAAAAADEIHGQALKFGCLGSHPAHVHVHNALIHLYASRAAPDASRQVFDEMPSPDVVSWSGLLTAYLRARDSDAARRVFDAMPRRDVVSWTAMISGYAQARRPRGALELFRAMPVAPDEVTMISVISACAALGDLEAGERVHCYIEERGFGWMVSLRNALVDMYSKCGCLHKARHLFDETSTKSLISWNSMISAYSAHGDADSATALFNQMVECGEGVRPDSVTVLSVLSACAHKGWVEEGRRVFEALRQGDYAGVEAGVEHYGCMVDLLGRAGLLEEAYRLIESMPIPSNDMVWGALLGACRIHGDVEMGERAVEKLMELKPNEGGYYILLSSIYAAAGRPVEAAEIRHTMKEKGARKTPGCSSWAGA